jgi:polyphenol oxidase
MLVRRESRHAVWYESPILTEIGVPHAFSTRLGGVSPPPFDSLNLGNPNGCDIQDCTDRIAENYLRLQTAIGMANRILLRVHQMHGNCVAVAGDGTTKADAIIVSDPRQIASVRVADCVPVLLASEDGAAVAAVHAGWRGVVSGVVICALKELRKIRPGAEILAAIGPCIGFEAFEVGPEVVADFEKVFGPGAPLRRRGDGKGNVDLRAAIARQLNESGLESDQVDSTDLCTFRDAEEFFSHRRDRGVTGRMAALIGAAAPDR